MLETKPPGAIIAEDERYNASLTRREDAHESLATFWVRFDGEPTPFESGQYMTIGVFTEGDGTAPPRIVQRPYSIASDPAVAGTEGYEMYVRLVDGGAFTPLLWQLPVGHRMRMIGPKGKFVLEPDDERTHLFISSGTGNAPFVSMMKALLREGRPRPAVFLNGVSYERDLGYRELLEGWERDWQVGAGGYPVTFVPTVSRPSAPENAAWTGREGRVESIVGPVADELGLTPDTTIAYICGNPDMILAVEATLAERGFPEEQVKKELYWPKGKEPRGPGGTE
jgi:ferredoxin/flavodoxin---NADP+ reductase